MCRALTSPASRVAGGGVGRGPLGEQHHQHRSVLRVVTGEGGAGRARVQSCVEPVRPDLGRVLGQQGTDRNVVGEFVPGDRVRSLPAPDPDRPPTRPRAAADPTSPS